jgi:hypothetical protein
MKALVRLLKKSGELFQSSPKLDDIDVPALQQPWAGISQRLRREFVSAACNNGILGTLSAKLHRTLDHSRCSAFSQEEG